MIFFDVFVGPLIEAVFNYLFIWLPAAVLIFIGGWK